MGEFFQSSLSLNTYLRQNLESMRLSFPCFLTILFTWNACQTPAPDPEPIDMTVKNFGLYDHNNEFHRLYYYDDAEAIVLYVQGNSCPIVRKSIRTIETIKKDYESKGVKFFMINSNLQDTRESIAREADEFDISIPILVDEDQLVAEIMDIHITAETFVLDPNNWNVIYRGPINDQLGYGSDRGQARENYLTDILDAHLAGTAFANEYRRAKGCAITRLSNSESYESLTYQDIAPILRDNCYQCHQVGGIAPWPMNGYPMVAGWSAMIREVLNTKQMPPWHADPHFGSFSNNISISQEEIRKIVSWINNGSKKGEGEDILASLTPNSSTWLLGEPDYSIVLDQEDIPADGIIDYRYQVLKIDIDENKYVKAIEVKPGNPNVLHHVLASIEYPEGYEAPVDRSVSRWIDGLLLGWAPGGEAEVFPQGTGRLLPKGSEIYFQLHYTTSGKEESDQTKIGLYFHDEDPGREYVILGPVNFEFKIPPKTSYYPVVAEYPINRPTYVHAVLPHMHYRGKSMNYEVQYPDGSKEMLFSAADYNFNWQRFYYLKEPKLLPEGATLFVNAVFDNSAQNEFNPDPEKTIYFGEQTFDEMMIGYMSVTFEEEEFSGDD